MPSPSSEHNRLKARQTLESISDTIEKLIEWNDKVNNFSEYFSNPNGMQLLAANCTLITAIGEGVNRINRIIPGFLSENFPDIEWRDIIGMRNHIAHGYFELDAELVWEVVKKDIPILRNIIDTALIII